MGAPSSPEKQDPSIAPGDFQRRRRRMPVVYTIWLLDQIRVQLMRIIDLMLALSILLCLSPLWGIVLLLALRQSPRFIREVRVGRWYESFNLYRVNLPVTGISGLFRRWHLDSFPILLAIISGKMAFVGPRATAPGELTPRDSITRQRYEVRPGLVGLWWVKHRGNIDFDPEAVIDAEYIATRSTRGDLGVLARAGVVLAYGGGEQVVASNAMEILNIPIHNLSMMDVLDAIQAMAAGEATKQVAFVNADCANIAYRDSEYLTILHRCAMVLADGIGMKLAGQLLKLPIRQNVNGTDLFPLLCERLSGATQGLYLLGGKPGVVDGVVAWIHAHYPAVVVNGYHHGYFAPEDEPARIAEIAASNAAVLLVAFGVPRQEKWLAERLSQTNVRVGMGVGGLFDFYSGTIPRAPIWMREIGMEWFFRFLQEPGRLWKRYFIGNAVFLWRVLRERRKHRPASKTADNPPTTES